MTSVACATLLFPSTSTSTSASNLIGRSPLPAWTRNRRNRRNRRKESTSTSVAAAAEQANTNSCHALFGKVVRERKRKRENTRASEQAREYKVATWLVAVLHLHFSSSALQLFSSARFVCARQQCLSVPVVVVVFVEVYTLTPELSFQYRSFIHSPATSRSTSNIHPKQKLSTTVHPLTLCVLFKSPNKQSTDNHGRRLQGPTELPQGV